MVNPRRLCRLLLALAIIFSCAVTAFANNLETVNVKLEEAPAGSHAIVAFDLSWENSWRNDLAGNGQAPPFNLDAAWVFIKFSEDGGKSWRHATLSDQMADHTVTTDNGVAASNQTVADGKGLILYRAENGFGTIDWEDVRVQWNHTSDGVTEITDSTIVEVFAIEMVMVPAGSYLAGDHSSAPIMGQFESETSGAPFEVAGEHALTLGGGGEGSLGNNNAEGMAHADDFNDGVSQTLPAEFPKGFAAFFVMKYEITQGQYADFLNNLTAEQAANRNPANEPDYDGFRGSIEGMYPVFEATAGDRACNFLSWMDGAAFADWAGLRPMTELEYEKCGRGDQTAISGEYAWGTPVITQAMTISGPEDGTELITDMNANSAFGDATLVGGDGGKGPLRSGIFAASVSAGQDLEVQRELAGAGFGGAMELSGNLWERVVTVGHPAGRSFTGTHGDGDLTDEHGFEGNATNEDWPGIDANPARGVTGADGAGFRGGGWSDQDWRLRTSDRVCSTTTDDQRKNHYGIRCVRTVPMTGD